MSISFDRSVFIKKILLKNYYNAINLKIKRDNYFGYFIDTYFVMYSKYALVEFHLLRYTHKLFARNCLKN